MNQEQKARVLAVIERDAEIQYHYCVKNNDGPHYCIIGGLLEDAGMPVPALQLLGVKKIGLPALAAARNLLLETFGLSRDVATVLQKTNDRYNGRIDRQSALVEIVEALIVEQATDEAAATTEESC